VVVEPNEPYEGHMWTWKAKITQFFIHMNSMVIGEFFSKASTIIRQHQHHHLLWLSNTCTGMVVLQPHPQQWPGNDIKPAHLLMHKFIPIPLVGQNNGILLAYD
jgi:hypothetical protein